MVALYDVKPQEQLALENFTEAKFFNSLRALIKSGIEIDTFAIASPNGYLQEQALQVLENNWHMVVEKPMN